MSSRHSRPPFHPSRCRPSTNPHIIRTPRLILRNAIPDNIHDASAIASLLSKPANNPYSPYEKNLSGSLVLERVQKWVEATEKGESSFMVVVLRQAHVPFEENGDKDKERIIGFGGYNAFKTPRMLKEEEEKEKWKKRSAQAVEREATINPSETMVATTTKTEAGSESGSDQHVIGDIGILIDHEYWRNGYALEAMCATIEYAFNDLNCKEIMSDTGYENEPLRALLRSMGLESSAHERVVDALPGQRDPIETKVEGHRIWTYRFGKELWEEAKKGMRARGRWPL